MADYKHVDYTVTDGRAEVVLNRPDVLNAFHDEMVEEILLALFDAHSDDRVFVILLTGAGRAFTSGADVTNMGEGGDNNRLEAAEHLWKVQNVVRYLYHGPKPSVAAINGPALGAGCDFALACDMRVMAEEAFLREQFVNIGLIPGDGGGWLLPRLVGEAKAKEFILTGKDITPEAALDAGLVAEVVESGESRSTARELANDLRDKPAQAMQNCKDLVGFGRSFEDYSQDAIDAQWRVRNDPEHDEAIRALQEDREPDFDRPY
jgi:enoyl-CoA hydratase/carnithine racemase